MGGASELAFLREPSDVIAVRDRPLLLDCQVEGEGPISITWRRNGVPVATGVRAAVLSNGTLLIRNFSKRREHNETDAGEYDCAAQNRYGMLISRKARVQLACEWLPTRYMNTTNGQKRTTSPLPQLYPSSCLTPTLWRWMRGAWPDSPVRSKGSRRPTSPGRKTDAR